MADTDVVKLLPCPVCGASTILHENDWCEPNEWVVVCAGEGCGISLGSDTDKANAVALGNRRSPSPAVEAKLQQALACGMVKIVASGDLFALIGPMRGLTRGTAEQRVSQLMREAWNKLPPCPDFLSTLSPKENQDG